ncbi:MAG: hypothetical protein C0612_08965 [Desulfobulbaceae bacterium]|nr:MAG: hypothetical protein C0612_08965 [Desulfobulbaceae bacterium]
MLFHITLAIKRSRATHDRLLKGDDYRALLPKTIYGSSTVKILTEQLPYTLTFQVWYSFFAFYINLIFQELLLPVDDSRSFSKCLEFLFFQRAGNIYISSAYILSIPAAHKA